MQGNKKFKPFWEGERPLTSIRGKILLSDKKVSKKLSIAVTKLKHGKKATFIIKDVKLIKKIIYLIDG